MSDARDAESPAVRHEVVGESPWVKRFIRAGQAALAAAAAAIGIAAAARWPELAGGAYFLGVGAAVVSGIGWAWARRRRPDPQQKVPLSASEDGVRVGDGPLISRAEVQEATITPRDLTFRSLPPWMPWSYQGKDEVIEVELRLAGRFRWPLRFYAKSTEDARAILDALGLGADRRAVVRKVMSPMLQTKVSIPTVIGGGFSIVLGGVLAQAVSPAFAVVSGLGVLVIAAFYVLGLIKTRVTLGADGVTVSWLGRRATVPLSDIAGVEIISASAFTPAMVRLKRKSGEPFDIQVALRGNNPFEPFGMADECERIAERIREAVSKGSAPEPAEFRAWAQHRRTMPTVTFARALRGALEDYRDGDAMPFSPSELWAVLTNARALEVERIAATVALTASSDEKTRARLADIAASTALPRLRSALEAAASGDGEALVGTLGELRDGELEAHAAASRDERPLEPPRVRVVAASENEGTGDQDPEDDPAAADAQKRRSR